MSDYKKLIFDRQDTVTTITLNRPEVHNALDRELSAELKDAILAVRADRECRVMILRGAGNTFCAGDDIKEFNEWKGDESYWQVRLYQETVQLIEDLTPVTIAAVDGVCTGGGLELTLVCDFVVATDRSRWGMPEIDWDITPGWGGLSRIPKFAGRRKAKEWNLIGMMFTAEKAERYDLVNRVVAPEELDDQVAQLTHIMLQKHPMTVRRTKFALNKSADLPVQGALAFEVPIMPYARGSSGLKDFKSAESRKKRRELSKDFWSD
ncbi:enoyl-CoA hydratase/isomerase family protein [Sneathiella sp. CAU 1612]|jgi:enoyl-CoA hydratase|uniref:Enoyl-CoA hydratase/isomerase family protein n=1 Tax=Sneathiella sedimenti TaxID=2816034 RepID=A0ABS3F271_9PROT|nr:enoyl-CoA hydratase/isomerase family protein [Sneathiella sedimenti]MBO0332499.1 enoyl-CoA hydratase/isomerase family protein [Sneathiella sedimenti]